LNTGEYDVENLVLLPRDRRGEVTGGEWSNAVRKRRGMKRGRERRGRKGLTEATKSFKSAAVGGEE
jgi:hypothetical protein